MPSEMRIRMKIGILGGTFDPPHIGHLIIGEQARQQLSLDKLLIMPTGNPGYKGRDDITPKETRAQMVKLSIATNPYFEYSDMEMYRDGYIYTYDTLVLLKEKYPDDQLIFIIGGDSLKNIMSWHRPLDIFKLCTIAVTHRDQVVSEEMSATISRLQMEYNADIVSLDIPLMDISSSNIRANIKNNISVKYLLEDKTYEYILNNGIYK